MPSVHANDMGVICDNKKNTKKQTILLVVTL